MNPQMQSDLIDNAMDIVRDRKERQAMCEHDNTETEAIESDTFDPENGHGTVVTGYAEVCVDCGKDLGEQ